MVNKTFIHQAFTSTNISTTQKTLLKEQWMKRSMALHLITSEVLLGVDKKISHMETTEISTCILNIKPRNITSGSRRETWIHMFMTLFLQLLIFSTIERLILNGLSMIEVQNNLFTTVKAISIQNQKQMPNQ